MVNFDVDDPLYRITPTQQMMCSCIGAFATSTLMTPLDVIKIRLQAQQNAMPSQRCFIYCNGLMDHCIICVNGNGKGSSKLLKEQWYKRPGHFNGTLDAFVKIVRSEGITSLWSGLSPTLVLAIPATVVYFTTYEQLRQMVQDQQKIEGSFLNGHPLWSTSLIAGGVARIWAVTLVSPLELIRTKMQSKKLSYQEVGVAIRGLVRSQGFFGLWQGLTPSLLRDVPFSALYWATYETFKKCFVPAHSTLTFYQSFVGGAISGTLAAVVTLPFDVVKTIRQLEFGEMEMASEKPLKKASTTREVIQRVYRQQGIGGLFAGLVPRIAKIAPACAIMISSYEYGKIFFSNYNRRQSAKLLEGA